MKRIAAGLMFAVLAVVPVLCAQTFTNVAPPSGPPGWTNSTQPPPAWYAVLSYGTNGVVSGTYSNLQLNARGSNEIARLVAAGTNGGGSVIFTNTSAGAFRGDWGAAVSNKAVSNAAAIASNTLAIASNAAALLVVQSIATNALPKSGGTITGDLILSNGVTLTFINTNARSLFIGHWAGAASTGTNNIFIGESSGDSSAANNSYGIGDHAGAEAQSGEANVYIGTYSGIGSSGSNEVFIGRNAGDSAYGYNGVYVGYGAGNLSHGQRTHAFGYTACEGVSGVNVHGFGIGAGSYNISNNIHAFGYQALRYGSNSLMTGLGPSAGFGANEFGALFIDTFVNVAGGVDPSRQSWTNNFLFLSSALEGNTQTGRLGRAEGVYYLRGNWQLVGTMNGANISNVPLTALRITNSATAGQVLTTSNGTNGYWSTLSGGGSVTTNYFLDLPALAGPWNADSTMLGPTSNNAPAFQVLRPFTTSATIRACAVNIAGTNTVQTRSFWGVMRLTASETNWASIAVEHLQTDATTTNQLSFSPLSQTNVLVSGTLTTGTNWIFSGTNFAGWREISVRCDTWHAAGSASTNWLPNIRSSRQ